MCECVQNVDYIGLCIPGSLLFLLHGNHEELTRLHVSPLRRCWIHKHMEKLPSLSWGDFLWGCVWYLLMFNLSEGPSFVCCLSLGATETSSWSLQLMGCQCMSVIELGLSKFPMQLILSICCESLKSLIAQMNAYTHSKEPQNGLLFDVRVLCYTLDCRCFLQSILKYNEIMDHKYIIYIYRIIVWNDVS